MKPPTSPLKRAPAGEFAAQAGNPDFVLSLARGLRVIESFEGHREGRSIVEISQSTGLSRASIRRILLTLELLGYVERTRQVYRLKTQVLRLGFSFLSSSSVVEAARPVLEHITEQLHESSSMSMLDGGQIVYVARSAASRVLAAGLSVGSRLPAYCTSMGRVLLAALPDAELETYLRGLKPRANTRNTITRIPQLKKAILSARIDGYAIVDEELELVYDRSRSPFPRAATGLSRQSMSELTCRASNAPPSQTAASPCFRRAHALFATYSSDSRTRSGRASKQFQEWYRAKPYSRVGAPIPGSPTTGLCRWGGSIRE